MARLRDHFGDHVPAREIERGFVFDGEPVRFVGPGMGIFKPKILRDGPLTVRTTLGSRYDDRLLADGGGLRYDFAPPAREYDNEGLMRLLELGHPLIYLIQVAPKSVGSEYAIFAQFARRHALGSTRSANATHQAHFRRIGLAAYRNQCAVCRLGARPLLDAAHLIPDRDLGEASVDNGIGMCALHHRAFDRGILA